MAAPALSAVSVAPVVSAAPVWQVLMARVRAVPASRAAMVVTVERQVSAERVAPEVPPVDSAL